MLPRRFRLTKDYDFRRVKNRGRRASAGFFGLGFVKNSQGRSRFGFIATKKLGKAVQRHRAVRLLREAVRRNLDKIKPGYDLVLIARNKILEVKMEQVERELKRVLAREGLGK